MRLQKYISSAGFCSRRKAEDLIAAGRVKVDGRVESELGFKVDGTKDLKIEIDGILLKKNLEKIYLILNKPRGYTCTTKKFKNEKNIYDLLPKEFHHLHYVGRLDKDSSGLLILTNDGDLTQKFTHPKFGHKKVYKVKFSGTFSKVDIDKFCNKIVLDGDKIKADLKILRIFDKSTEAEITIYQGKKRQIRRMFEVVGFTVLRLHRIQMGEIKLPENLENGEYVRI